jgi:capsular polysaccharide transport system ATP-binding protein
MITLEKVTKRVQRAKPILLSVDFQIPTDRRIAVLGPAGPEKRGFMNLLAGTDMPESGRVVRHKSVSFPVGDLPGFIRELSVRINVAHVARLYGADVRWTVNTVEKVTKIGARFDRPYEQAAASRRELAYAVAFSLPFDVYVLADDKLAREWSRQQSSKDGKGKGNDIVALFGARMESAGMIIATDDVEFARKHCDLGLFLHGGELALTEDMSNPFDEAKQEHRKVRAIARRRARLIREKRG